jgi:RNA polymerase sigma factor (sigma-70 family)
MTNEDVYSASTDFEAMLEGCRRGDPAAQKAFYDRLAPFALGVCRRYLSDPMEAEDAMIKAMYKALSSLSTLRETPNLRAWLRRIAVNECLMILRSARDLIPLDALHAPKDESPSMPERMEADHLHTLVAQLPPGYRAVFNLYVVEGYTHREIGELLGISLNTSKSQLIHARNRLAAMWRALKIEPS